MAYTPTIHKSSLAGVSVYIMIRDDATQAYWNPDEIGFVELTDTRADFSAALTEIDDGLHYDASHIFGGINEGAGYFTIEYYKQIGGSPAVIDTLEATEYGYFDGANLLAQGTVPTAGSVTGNVGGNVTGNVGGNVVGSVASVTAGVALTSGERTTLAGVIWNSLTSGFVTAGSIGKRIVDYLTGDIFARIGATGSGLTSLAPSATALSTAQWTSSRAGYLDNIRSADFNTRLMENNPILLAYDTIEVVNSQTEFQMVLGFNWWTGGGPTDLAGAIIVIYDTSNADRPCLRRVVQAGATTTIDSACDFTVVQGDTIRIFASPTQLETIRAKLPSKAYLTGTTNSDGDIQLNEATGALPASSITASTIATGAITSSEAPNLDGSISSVLSAVAAVAAYVDTEIAAIKLKTDNLPSQPAAVGSTMTLESGERTSIGNAILARPLTDGGTVMDAMQAALAQGCGKWELDADTRILTIYAQNGSTVLAELLIEPNLSTPLTRTPQ